MFLKDIEMQGFKSFADKTKVSFDRGVTAVVGPNGSGKSNITESLRWALGESSAKSLRGGKMPDVIFAGTESRKPHNYASVKVVLDNSDGFIKTAGTTISVERHIYRNGDNDYLIDGKKVRLRDIHDLFMDTGLGRDSFSIISQGRVEAIFNAKPEERRAIFEEAAGVLKYKTRKKETQTKLNQTQDNLDRLEDIIYELEAQVKLLAKQAQTAQAFVALDAQRSSLQLSVLVADIVAAKGQMAQLETALSQAQQDLKDYNKQRASLEEENQEQKAKRQELTKAVNDSQTNLLELTKLATELKGQLERQELERHQGIKTKSQAQERLQNLQAETAQNQAELVSHQERLVELSQVLEQTQATIDRLEVDLGRFTQSPDQILEGLREDFVQLMRQEADLSNQLTQVEGQLDQEQKAQADQLKQGQELAQEVSDLKSGAQAALQAYQDLQADLAALLTDYQELSRRLAEQERTYGQAQDQLFAGMDRLKNLKAKEASLLAIQKNHSNFYAGVKSVLQAKDRLSGIIGAVSQLLTFEATYQTALEVALGGASQHLVVADEAAAQAAIAFLKANRQGRATFLPLTTIKPRQVSQSQQVTLMASPGYLGMASDLVQFSDQHEVIFRNLLGATAIFQNTDQATQAARKLNYQVRLVTLDGTEIRPGGSFAGGANRQQSTTFIQPELDLLAKQIAEQDHTVRQLEQEVASLKVAMSQIREDQTQIKAEGDDKRLAEQKAQLTYQQAADKLKEVQALYQGLLAQQGLGQSEDLQAQKAALTANLATIDQQKTALTQQIDQLKTDKDSLVAQLEDLRASLAQAQLDQREAQSEHRFALSQTQRLEQNLSRLKAEEAQVAQIIASNDQNQPAIDMDLLVKQLNQAQASQEAEQTKLIRLQFELDDCEAGLEDLADRFQKLTQQNDGLIRQQTSLEAQQGQLAEKLQAFARSLAEDFQLSFTEASQEAQVLDNLDLARQALKDLNRQIKALGPINLEAIDQFSEVSDRLAFLSGQRDDLLEAKNMLQATIDDMDGEVKARFKTTFEAIRESFKTTFSQMFGGGSADLVLTEQDLLTAGVEISAQPPGKKIQSLNLMSGGEKALTALALLFAIIRVKTIPFVILDEVEAALDEANVKRFGDYLNRFDKSSQFIVVTHRRGTMAAADSIYGVTMQESGVSKIVSVKLKEAQSMVK